MIALRLHGVHDVRVHDEEPPEPRAGEVRLRVTSVGLCGSDLHWYEEGGIGETLLGRPLVLGHELAAVIADGPRRGERVAVDPAIACGRCASCRRGDEHLCTNGRFAGHGETDGALQQVLAWPETLVHAVPDSLSDAAVALLEPLGVALHAVDLARLEQGATAGVFGCGPLGLLLLQVLRTRGVEVVAADPLAHRAEAAAALGAVQTIPGDGVDVAFEVAGDDGALATAIDAVRPGGTVVVVGIPSNDRTSFGAAAARRKELTLVLCRRMRGADLPRAIELARGGGLELDALVSDRFALRDGAAAFEAAAARRGLKVIVEPEAA